MRIKVMSSERGRAYLPGRAIIAAGVDVVIMLAFLWLIGDAVWASATGRVVHPGLITTVGLLGMTTGAIIASWSRTIRQARTVLNQGERDDTAQ